MEVTEAQTLNFRQILNFRDYYFLEDPRPSWGVR